MKEDDRAINEILWAIARGTSIASLMRAHGFTRTDLNRWQSKYGMPYFYKEPSPTKLAALGRWRRARTRLAAWRSFRNAARAIDGEVPDDSITYDNYAVRAWARSRVLLVCEKNATHSQLESWQGDRPSFAFVHRAALAHTCWLPSHGAARGLMANARGLPVAWFGDLDPQAIHWYAALRAGGWGELLRSNRRRHRIGYVGLDSTWLDWIDGLGKGSLRFTIDLRHWEVVQHLVPDARELIGERASRFLDSGKKIEVDGLLIQHANAFAMELGRRLRTTVLQSKR